MFGRSRRPEQVIGVALSGGGTRGAWQVGGVRALEERHLTPSLISGSSAGAINAAWYALTPRQLDRLETIWLSLRQKDIFPGNPVTILRNFLRRGYLHSSDALERLLRRYVGDASFEECAIPCSIVAVRLSDGQRVVFDSGPIVPAVMASAAIPGVYPPYEIGGELYVDGGLLEFLPLEPLFDRGATDVFAFDCSYFAPGAGTTTVVVDRAARIGSQYAVERELARHREAGLRIHLLRPELPESLDSRDFSLTAGLIRDGYLYTSHSLDQILNNPGDSPRSRVG